MKKESKSEPKHNDRQEEAGEEEEEAPKNRNIDCPIKDQEKRLKKMFKIIDSFLILNNKKKIVGRYLTSVAEEFRMERDENWKPGKEVVNLQDRLSILRFYLLLFH